MRSRGREAFLGNGRFPKNSNCQVRFVIPASKKITCFGRGGEFATFPDSALAIGGYFDYCCVISFLVRDGLTCAPGGKLPGCRAAVELGFL